jgi:hypothetical protein
LEEKATEMKDGFINASRKYMGSLSNLDNGIFDQAQNFTGLQPTLCIRLHSLTFLFPKLERTHNGRFQEVPHGRV